MTRYWVIAPIESKNAEFFETVWNFDLANGLVSIGWSELGDVSKAPRTSLLESVRTAFPEKPPQTQSLIANMLWAFYHDIEPGDHVIARRGRKILAGVGRVTAPAVHSPGRNPATSHAGFLSVAWNELPRDRAFPEITFPMHTLAELSESQYNHLLGSTGDPASEPGASIEDPSAFVLEKYLEEFIVSNFEKIFKGRLRIYSDGEGGDGQQYTTDIGSIDILALEPTTNSLVVIELKKGRPSDQVVGQVLRYMGWVKRNLCTQGQTVKGLVICRDPDPKLSYALEMIDSVSVSYYSVSFRLQETP